MDKLPACRMAEKNDFPCCLRAVFHFCHDLVRRGERPLFFFTDMSVCIHDAAFLIPFRAGILPFRQLRTDDQHISFLRQLPESFAIFRAIPAKAMECNKDGILSRPPAGTIVVQAKSILIHPCPFPDAGHTFSRRNGAYRHFSFPFRQKPHSSCCSSDSGECLENFASHHFSSSIISIIFMKSFLSALYHRVLLFNFPYLSTGPHQILLPPLRRDCIFSLWYSPIKIICNLISSFSPSFKMTSSYRFVSWNIFYSLLRSHFPVYSLLIVLFLFPEIALYLCTLIS